MPISHLTCGYAALNLGIGPDSEYVVVKVVRKLGRECLLFHKHQRSWGA